MLRLFLSAFVCLALALPAAAERQRLGYGRLISNDSVLGDWQDRWHTGSIATSRVWGPEWGGKLPERPGALLELRFNFQVIAPSQLEVLNPADRPYAGAISIGGHTHFEMGGLETAAGVDLVITGPQTGMTDVQDALHDLIDFNEIGQTVRDSQIPNGVHPTAVVEVARAFATSSGSVRPFTELRAGVETLWRAGVDVTIGDVGKGELLVRDPVTGQRYRTVWNPDHRGRSFVLGADVTYVADSVFLPGNGTYAAEDMRTRLRAGIHLQSDTRGFFYGLAWLGPEFTTQTEGQFVGSIRYRFRF